MNRWMLAILALLALAGGAGAQAPADPERIDALMRKLGSSAFVQREQAAKELEAIGPAALPALRGAAKTQDAESARRIAELIARLEQQLLARQILTPKEYDWKIEAASVQEAIVALKEKTGYAIEVQENAGQLAAKKITITGKLPFWQALDKLCEQAGLVEAVGADQFPPPASTAKGPLADGSGRSAPAQPIVLAAYQPPQHTVVPFARIEELDFRGKTEIVHVGIAIKAGLDPDEFPTEARRLLGKIAVITPTGDGNFIIRADVGSIRRCLPTLLGEKAVPREKLKPRGKVDWNERRVLLDVNGKSWDEAIAWFSREAEMPVAKAGLSPPSGTVSCKGAVGKDGRPVGCSLVEAFDALNGVLIERHDMVILRRETTLTISPLPGYERRFRTSHAGAVKAELRLERDAKAKEIVATLIISPEPGLLNGGIAGPPVFTKWIDSAGRAIAANVDAPKQAGGRIVKVRFKDDIEKIKEMAGTLPLQVDLQNVVLAKMDKIMDAAGKSVAGANGGSLKVQSIKKSANDGIEIQVAMENLMPNPLGDNILINGNNIVIRGNVQFNGNVVIGAGGIRMNGVGAKDLPDLIDAKGQKFKIASIPSDGISISNGSSSRTATVVYQPNPGQAAPSELVFFGTRTHTIAVPFRFENVPLP